MYHMTTIRDSECIDTDWEEITCLHLWRNTYLYIFKYGDPINHEIVGYGISIQHNRS